MSYIPKHYVQHIDAQAERKLDRVLDFFEQEGLCFYNVSSPVIHECSEGSKKYVEITVSIKLA